MTGRKKGEVWIYKREKRSEGHKDKPQQSYRIIVHRENCSGCGICELACSLYHEKQCSLSLSRIRVLKDFLRLEFEPVVCIQCEWPSCYFECTAGAIGIDQESGARYIDPDTCTGCGRCEKVCPLMPEKEVLFHKAVTEKRRVYFKCDLCRGREEGPLCVEMCTRNALELIGK